MDSKVSYKDRKPHQVILTLNHSPVYSYRCKTEVSTVNNNTANQVDKVLSLFNNDLHSFISGKCKHQNQLDLLLIKLNKYFSFLIVVMQKHKRMDLTDLCTGSRKSQDKKMEA